MACVGTNLPAHLVYVKNWRKDGWRAFRYQYVWTIVCGYIRFNSKTKFCIPFGDTMLL